MGDELCGTKGIHEFLINVQFKVGGLITDMKDFFSGLSRQKGHGCPFKGGIS